MVTADIPSSFVMDSMNPSEVLRRITAALQSAGIDYMLTGSFASDASWSATIHPGYRYRDLSFARSAERFVNSMAGGEYYADADAALEAHSHQSIHALHLHTASVMSSCCSSGLKRRTSEITAETNSREHISRFR